MRPGIDPPRQASLFSDRDRLREELQHIDINAITPLDALKVLAELKRRAED
jgi:hypothetical protein